MDKLSIYYDFKSAIAPVIELMQIVKHKSILSRMKVTGRLMKQNKRELDDMRHQSSSKQRAEKNTLYTYITTKEK